MFMQNFLLCTRNVHNCTVKLILLIILSVNLSGCIEVLICFFFFYRKCLTNLSRRVGILKLLPVAITVFHLEASCAMPPALFAQEHCLV